MQLELLFCTFMQTGKFDCAVQEISTYLLFSQASSKTMEHIEIRYQDWHEHSSSTIDIE